MCIHLEWRCKANQVYKRRLSDVVQLVEVLTPRTLLLSNIRLSGCIVHRKRAHLVSADFSVVR
jgi:hypothetical protein